MNKKQTLFLIIFFIVVLVLNLTSIILVLTKINSYTKNKLDIQEENQDIIKVEDIKKEISIFDLDDGQPVWDIVYGDNLKIEDGTLYLPDKQVVEDLKIFNNFALSPDSKKIIFYETIYEGAKQNVILVDFESKDIKYIVKDSDYFVFNFKWGVDSNYILYSKYPLGASLEERQVILLDLKTNKESVFLNYPYSLSIEFNTSNHWPSLTSLYPNLSEIANKDKFITSKKGQYIIFLSSDKKNVLVYQVSTGQYYKVTDLKPEEFNKYSILNIWHESMKRVDFIGWIYE